MVGVVFEIRDGFATRIFSYPTMKKLVKVEVVEEGEKRFLIKTYSDGEEVRAPIVKLPRKKRYPDRPYWRWV